MSDLKHRAREADAVPGAGGCLSFAPRSGHFPNEIARICDPAFGAPLSIRRVPEGLLLVRLGEDGGAIEWLRVAGAEELLHACAVVLERDTLAGLSVEERRQ